MSSILHLIILIAVVWYCAYRRANLWAWISVVGLVLLLETYFKSLSITWLFICWVIYLGITALFTVTPLRHRFLTRPVMGFLRRVLPPMSRTEKEAIEAGDVWWEGDLFCGNPDWKKLLGMPKPILKDEEQSFLNHQVEKLCMMLDDWKIVAEDCNLTAAIWDYLKKEKFLGMVIPKQYGGLGFSGLAHSSVVAKIASRSISSAVNVMVPNSLGPGELLVHYGTEEQKNYYLPRLAVGEEIPCFALTSENAGSDAASMNDVGVVCKGLHDGKEVIGVRLTWSKRYITLAPIATVLGLAVKLQDPEHLIGDKSEVGITLFLVPTSHPGVEIGRRHFPMEMAFMNGPTAGKDVFVPLDWIIGGAAMAGNGWRMLMECLSMGRGISLPSLSTAGGQVSYRMTGIYARLRQQFKLPIGKFEGVEEAMARIAGFTYMLNATRIMTAGAVDQKVKPAVASAIAKYHMTEMMRIAANDAMDIHAGRGVQFGPRNYLGIPYVSIPIAITVEGANILTRNLMIFGQGAIRCHPYVLKEMEAAADTDIDRGFKAFDGLLFSHIGYAVSNFFRAFWMGLSCGKLVDIDQHGPLVDYYKQLTRMSTALALVSDISMLMLGGELKRKERLSARLGDVLSYLYLASATLKYYYDLHSQPEDVPYVEWCLQYCLAKMQQAFDGFLENFPMPWVGKALKFILFPYGTSYTMPTDRLSHKLAMHMMTPSPLRDRLSNLISLGESKGDQDIYWRMENAFNLVLAAEPIEQKVLAAVKAGTIAKDLSLEDKYKQALALEIITQQDLNIVNQAEAARFDALRVDDFAFDAFVRKNLN